MPNSSREILIPYDPAAGPVTAVRNVILQASLSQLRERGHFERYAKLIAPATLEQLIAMSIAPGWIPIELALAHYEACDSLMLTREQFAEMGSAVGERVQGTVLISSAKKSREAEFDPWSANAPLNRMWARLYQGGTVQVTKVGPHAKLLEQRGFQLSRYHYYRQGQAAALRAIQSAIGARNVETKVDSYSPARDELVIRVSWT
ncbi:MAG: hypothetical protein RLZZ450_938 [Pseudomonadota bacterium]|jgi:hypothetical protein